MLEFICDGVAAGKAYSRNRHEKWENCNPLNYWNNVDKKSLINEKTKKKIEFYYNIIAIHGLNYFCDEVRKRGDFYEEN